MAKTYKRWCPRCDKATRQVFDHESNGGGYNLYRCLDCGRVD